MNPKQLKKIGLFIAACLVYILIIHLIGWEWGYFGLLFICDAFFWHYVLFRSKRKPKPKRSGVRDWADALIFAIVAATLIRTFFFEAYTIPTPSMEKSMMVGDFLFVSKMHYGPKVPNTPLSFPFVHNTLPGTKNTKSYLEWIQWDYHRLPGFSEIQRNDIVVFNYPMDEGVPVDKKTNYIKRCVGTPGDTLSIVDTQIMINGEASSIGDRGELQFTYYIETTNPFHPRVFQNLQVYDVVNQGNRYQLRTTASNIEKIKAFSNVKFVQPIVLPDSTFEENCFPSDPRRAWNKDNYGPIYIPQAGVTVPLDSMSLPLYRRIINTYEENSLEERADGIYINGEKTSTYTFKYNYYWMMGDNRHNSLDSRYWGFVPENHIVGKAVFVWFSWDSQAKGLDKIRWNRLMTVIHGDGEPHSFLPYVLAILAFFIGRKQYRKYKAKQAA